MEIKMSEEKIKEQISYLMSKDSYSFDDLRLIVSLLRSKQGCPWDMEQTHKSIRNDFIEETYEVIEAIDTENPELLREELGDVMLQVVFHAQLEDEKNVFDIDDVSNDICKKLIHRHPHVFGDVRVDGSREVLSNWDKIKSEEKGRATYTDKLKAIPPMFPALMRAQKVGKKASCFDFNSLEEVYSKIYEEIDEVKEAEKHKNHDEIEEEIGDLLLTVSSLSRKLGINSEEALYKATNKFIERFATVENEAVSMGKSMDEIDNGELNAIWDKIK